MSFAVFTEHKFASDSPDFLRPWGARNDETYCPGFTKWLLSSYGKGCYYLDLGCAGGGLVADARAAGIEAIGIDGSDEPQRIARPPWMKYPEAFFNADISQPFEVYLGLIPVMFHVISAWEVPEHIPEIRLPQFFMNIKRHLSSDGSFVGTVSQNTDQDYHQTVKPRDWWVQKFQENGFVFNDNLPEEAQARKDGGSFVFVARKI